MTLFKVLYSTSAAITVRSIFRVIEYIQGNGGCLLRNEVWLSIFDSVLIAAVVIAFNVAHPAVVILSDGRKQAYADRAESTQGLEMEMERGSEHELRW